MWMGYYSRRPPGWLVLTQDELQPKRLMEWIAKSKGNMVDFYPVDESRIAETVD